MSKFDVEEFCRYIKNEFSNDITIEHAAELQNLADSFKCTLDILVSAISHGWFFAYLQHHYSLYIPIYESAMLKHNHKHLVYVRCVESQTKVPIYLFFDKYELKNVHQHINRIERLKAFL